MAKRRVLMERRLREARETESSLRSIHLENKRSRHSDHEPVADQILRFPLGQRHGDEASFGEIGNVPFVDFPKRFCGMGRRRSRLFKMRHGRDAVPLGSTDLRHQVAEISFRQTRQSELRVSQEQQVHGECGLEGIVLHSRPRYVLHHPTKATDENAGDSGHSVGYDEWSDIFGLLYVAFFWRESRLQRHVGSVFRRRRHGDRRYVSFLAEADAHG